MKIRILKNVRLDFEGKVKEYPSYNQVLQIDDQIALEKDYLARYKKYPKHIEIVEEPKIKVNEQKNEDKQTEGIKASSKTESNKKGNKKERLIKMSLNKNNIYKNYSDLISDKEFDQIKNYLKVDMDYEDDLIKELLDSAALILIDAIDSSKQPVDFSEEPRFQLAVKKQVKEEYEHRGLSSDSTRHKLANGVENIIHQLRVKVAMQSDHT